MLNLIIMKNIPTMKTIKIFLYASFTMLLLSNSQCKKEYPLTLPPDGQGTFACLINGKVFVEGPPPVFGGSGAIGGYVPYNNTLIVQSYLRPEGQMEIKVVNPLINTPMSMTSIRFFGAKNYSDKFSASNAGEIVITRIDTIPYRAVSGRFSFDDGVHVVTEGRFNL